MALEVNHLIPWTEDAALQEGKRVADELRERHPNRSSACGVLLSEIVHGTDFEDRGVAAMAFWYLKCRRGANRLSRSAFDLARQIKAGGDAGAFASRHRKLLKSILWAISDMDTPQSHEVLVRLLSTCRDPDIRGDVLEVMSEEEKMLDKSLLLPSLSSLADPSEITSSLYTLERTDYVRREWQDALRRVTPLLQHPDPYVRGRAIYLLGWRLRNRDLVLEMLEDPDPGVREYALEALAIWQKGPISG